MPDADPPDGAASIFEGDDSVVRRFVNEVPPCEGLGPDRRSHAGDPRQELADDHVLEFVLTLRRSRSALPWRSFALGSSCPGQLTRMNDDNTRPEGDAPSARVALPETCQRTSEMSRSPGNGRERYEHVGALSPTARVYRGVYQFTNEPSLVHLVEWDHETTLCGMQRESFDELDPVFQIDDFPSCDECREIANLQILDGLLSRESEIRTEALREANRTDSQTPPGVINDLMTRVGEGLNALRDAIIAGDRDAYIAARRNWQSIELELEELLP